MFSYQLESSTKSNCGVSVDKNFITIGSRKIVLKHVTGFAVYSYNPFTIIGFVLLLAGIAAGIFGAVEYETGLYILAGILAVVGIVLMCIKKTVLYVHSSCEADKTEIKGSKDVLNALFNDIETYLSADSILSSDSE